MSYTQHLARGVSWMSGLKVASQLLAIGRLYILTRLFVPDDFGQIGIVLIVLAFLEIATDGGVQMLVVQHSETFLRKTKNALFTFSVARGILIAAVIAVLAQPLAGWFEVEQVRNLLYLAALIPIIRGFVSPYLHTWQRDLQFFHQAGLQFSVEAIISVATVVIALMTGSISAVLLGMIAGAIAKVVASHYFFEK